MYIIVLVPRWKTVREAHIVFTIATSEKKGMGTRGFGERIRRVSTSVFACFKPDLWVF
jgi:hypothetical protein